MVIEQIDNLDTLRAGETAALTTDSLYAPNPHPQKIKNSSKLQQKLKNKALIFIIGSIIAFTGVITASQAALPFAIASNLVMQYNTIRDASKSRGNFLRKITFWVKNDDTKPEVDITDGKKYKHPLKTGIYGQKKLSLSRKQLKRLKKTGFEVEDKKLFFRGKGKNIEINADNIEHYLKTDPDIQTAYHDASKTWRGNITGWFDSKVKGTLNRLGVKFRKRFHDWHSSGNDAEDLKNFKNLARNPVDSESESNLRNRTQEPELDENGKPVIGKDGKPVMRDVVEDSSSGNVKTGGSEADATAAAKAAVNHELKTANKVGSIANSYCAIATFANNLNLLVSAAHLFEIANLAGTFLEATDKVRAGNGRESPINSYMKILHAKDKNGKSAIESFGMQSIFGRKSFSKNNRSITLNSREGISSNLFNKIPGAKFDKNKYLSCNATKAAAGIISAAVVVFTFGIGGLVKGIVSTIAENATKIALSVLAANLLPYAINLLSEKLLTKPFAESDFLGEKGGDGLAAGGHYYLSENAKSGGQSPADKQHLIAFYRDVVTPSIQEEATIARQKLSPFDLSSEHTFFGSIFNKSLPLLTSTQPGIPSLSSLAIITKGSLASILPSAQALNETDLVKTEGECPNLASIGAIGDAFCNPYYITDSSTLNIHPGSETGESVFTKVYDLGRRPYPGPVNLSEKSNCSAYYASSNFEIDNTALLKGCDLGVKTNEEGNPIINPYSKLGAHINFCGMRSSNLGAIDGNITSWARYINFNAGSFSGTRHLLSQNNTISSLAGSIPLLGDAVDVIQSVADLDDYRINLVNGQSCVASSDNPYWENEIKYYQRYAEDQRYFENAGMINESATTHVINEYLAVQPLDNSPAGILSRFSGLPKSQVIATLNYLDYQIALRNYHPHDLAPLPAPTKFQNLNISNTNFSLPEDLLSTNLTNRIIYAPLRHRNFAA